MQTPLLGKLPDYRIPSYMDTIFHIREATLDDMVG